MVTRFSKSTETRKELSTTCNPKVMSRCLSAPDATSLHHCLYYLKLNSGVGHKRPVERGFVTPFYTSIVVLFQAFPASWGDNQSYASISHTILKICAFIIGFSFTVWTKMRLLSGSLADGVLADAILIPPCPPIPPTNLKNVRGPRKKYGN